MKEIRNKEHFLTLSWKSFLPYRIQSIDFPCKSKDWFLYDSDLRLELKLKIDR